MSSRNGRQAEESERPEGCKSIYVGNLPFSITDHDLQSMFQDCGEIDQARCVTDRETGRSRGYGYVDFTTESAVDAALAKNGTELEGRQIRIDFGKGKNSAPRPDRVSRFGDARPDRGADRGADRGSRGVQHSDRPEGCKSIYVGNLAFSVTDDDLRSMFEDCGAIDHARCVTDRETGRSRGYGYVDFSDESSINSAIAKDGMEVGGRAIRIDFSKGKSSAPRGGRGGFSSRGGRGENRY